MSKVSTYDACLLDLFSDEAELREKYHASIVQRLLRIRELYSFVMEKPESKDRQIVDFDIRKFGIGKSAAYNDLAIIKALLPNLSKNTREWHRWRYNTLILETYEMAKRRKDTKTMERVLSSYAKYNAIDVEDERDVPFELIVVQPFVPTQDPTVLGIKPLPNRREKIKELIAKYSQMSADIMDVDYEPADMQILADNERTAEDKSADLL